MNLGSVKFVLKIPKDLKEVLWFKEASVTLFAQLPKQLLLNNAKLNFSPFHI